MAEVVRLIEPEKIQRNPENPRLIFRQEELDARISIGISRQRGVWQNNFTRFPLPINDSFIRL